MKHKLAGIIPAMLLVSIGLKAQEVKVLSLQEAINLSISNSKILQHNKAKIEEATAFVKENEDKRLPGASVYGSYLRLSSAKIDLKNKPSGSGGSNESPNVSQAIYGIANISLPLFAGGRIRYGVESARLLQKASLLDAESQKDEVIQTTIEAFANLFKANTALRLVKENLQQSQQREKELTVLEKNGLLSRNDLLKAQLQSSNIELNLLDADNNLQMAGLNMNLLLGLPANTQLALDTNGIEKKEDSRPMEELIGLALKERKDIAALDLRRKAAETNSRIIRAEKLPAIQLTGGYIAADIPNVLTVTNAVNIGLGISYDIGSMWKNRSKIMQAESRVKQVRISESLLDDKVRLQVSQQYLSVLSYRKKIEVYSKAREQAEENYRIVNNKFDNNLATVSDLLEADVAKLQATLSHTLARADAFVAYHKLLQSAGLLSAELKK
jgi:outer membrane protein TolC